MENRDSVDAKCRKLTASWVRAFAVGLGISYKVRILIFCLCMIENFINLWYFMPLYNLRIISEEGFRDFWKGNLVAIAHRLPYSSINFYAFERYKNGLRSTCFSDKLNTTAGSFALLGSVVPQDAAVVVKLRKLGVIILGKASLSEWANFSFTCCI